MSSNERDEVDRWENSILESVMGTFFEDLNGIYISEVGNCWRDQQSIVIITAWNPNFIPVSDSDNQRQHLLLQQILQDSCKDYEEILAWWPDRKGFERSFAVKEMTHVEARMTCLRFGQAAYFRANRGERIQLVKIAD